MNRLNAFMCFFARNFRFFVKLICGTIPTTGPTANYCRMGAFSSPAACGRATRECSTLGGHYLRNTYQQAGLRPRHAPG